MPYKVVPKQLGHGEGGQRTPALQELFDGLAQDLELLYTTASLNPAARVLRSAIEPKVVVSGTVTDEYSSDEVEGVTVAAFIKDTDDRAAWVATLEDGTYKLPVYPGTYDIKFIKNGYMDKDVANKTFTADTTLDTAIYPCLEVLETNPEAGDTEVIPTDTITLKFSQTLTDNSGDGDIKDGVVVEVGGEAVVVSNATISTDTLTITLDKVLESHADVVVTVEAEGTVKGPKDELLAQDYTFGFSTVAAYLEVKTLVPDKDATAVGTTDTIVITFDRDIVDNSGEGKIEDGIKILDGDEPAVIDTIDITNATLTITLEEALAEGGQVVTVKINAEGTVAADDDGGLLAEDLEYVFTMDTE